MDEGSFEEIGIGKQHRTTDFGMAKELYYGDVCHYYTELLMVD
jgi:propionyl-CoA carboxylase beta chain